MSNFQKQWIFVYSVIHMWVENVVGLFLLRFSSVDTPRQTADPNGMNMLVAL